MKFLPGLFIAILSLAAIGAAARAEAKGLIADDEELYRTIRNIGDEIGERDGRPIQIVYLHGMRAEEPDASQYFRRALEKEYGLELNDDYERTFVDPDPNFRGAAFYGEPLWNDDNEWKAIRPFVDTYRYVISGKTILVSELNWWPVLHPLKCRFLIKPETLLSGIDENHINLCAGISRNPKAAGLHYSWFSDRERRNLLAAKQIGGKAAWPNGWIKQQVMNWGLSDAVIALGNLRPILAHAVDEAFKTVNAQTREDTKTIAISESLGSFVLLDAAELGGFASAFVDRTSDYYFFANQFALLELARVNVSATTSSNAIDGAKSAPRSPLQRLLEEPAQIQVADRRVPQPRQIVALHDPSDALTFLVPRKPGANSKVVNLFVRESGGPFRLFAHPIKAHRGAITDRRVWKELLTPKNP